MYTLFLSLRTWMLTLIVLNTQGKIMKQHDILTFKSAEIDLNTLITRLNQYLYDDADESVPDEQILTELLIIRNKISFALNNNTNLKRE